MSLTSNPTTERLTNDELRTLFLFESLDDEQLSWLAERSWVSASPYRRRPCSRRATTPS